MGILDRAELLLRAERYSGSGDWLDESGNGHDAQLGSGSGSDTNDPLFKPYDGTQYLYLPGTSGNYASTADVNLLDADTAHLQQSVGEWDRYAAEMANNLAISSEQSLYGDNSLRCEVGTDTSGGYVVLARQNGYPSSASGSTAYAASIWVYQATGASLDVRLGILWYQTTTFKDAVYSSDVSVPSGVWTEITVNGTSHVDTTQMRLAPEVNTTSTPISDGDVIYLDQACFRTGSDGTFVPSLRIVGDLDIEAKSALDWVGSSGFQVLGRYGTTGTSYHLALNTSDEIYMTVNDAVNPAVSVSGSLSDGQIAVVRGTYVASTGVMTLYVDGSSVGTDTVAATTPTPDPDVTIFSVGDGFGLGAPLDGDIYYVIVRDGIDGPVVAEYRAADASEPFATHTGSVDGRTWTHNRSASGLVSTVVDRDMFLLTTDDYFTIPDADGLDFGASSSGTVVALVRQTDASDASEILLDKGGISTTKGWYIAGNAANTLKAGLRDTAYFEDTTAQSADLSLFAVASRWDRSLDELEVFVDGVGSGSATDISSAGDLSNAVALYIGSSSAPSAYFEGQVVAVALFREALTDNEIYLAGRSLIKQVDDPQDLHGDALKTWIIENDSNWTSSMSTELVGLLNDLNGTSGKEYAEARATYLSVDPAG